MTPSHDQIHQRPDSHPPPQKEILAVPVPAEPVNVRHVGRVEPRLVEGVARPLVLVGVEGQLVPVGAGRVLLGPLADLGPVLALVVFAVVDEPGLVEAWVAKKQNKKKGLG